MNIHLHPSITIRTLSLSLILTLSACGGGGGTATGFGGTNPPQAFTAFSSIVSSTNNQPPQSSATSSSSAQVNSSAVVPASSSTSNVSRSALSSSRSSSLSTSKFNSSLSSQSSNKISSSSFSSRSNTGNLSSTSSSSNIKSSSSLTSSLASSTGNNSSPASSSLSSNSKSSSSKSLANSSSSSTSSEGNIKIYWVKKIGSDNNTCLGESNACASIQKAISLLVAGDMLNIGAGTYIENSSTSPYTKKCGWFDPQIASLCINSSGEVNKPIVISAAQGDEGKVIIDSQNERLGLQIASNDNLEIKGLKFINNRGAGIANYGQAQNAIPDNNLLSKNVLIKGNTFINTADEWGTNPSAIAMWSTQAWTVEDNYIDTVIQEGGRAAAGIMAYGVIEAKVKNNTIKNAAFGVFWKDHFIKDAARTLYQESEIAFNLIEAPETGIKISIRGQGSPEAGHNDFHHNIIKILQPDGGGISSSMAGAEGVSGNLIIRNNLIDCGGNARTAGIGADSHLSTKIYANIIFGADVAMEFPVFAEGKSAKLVESDFNIFDDNFQVIADRYSAETKYFRSIYDWRMAQYTDVKSFKNLQSPDMNSKLLAKADILNSDYTFKKDSPALKMVNGKNPGPYENGNEQIGAPKNL